MEFKELKKKKLAELDKILASERDKLRELRFKDANKQLKDVRLIRKTRATIARIITLLNKNRVVKKSDSLMSTVVRKETKKKEQEKTNVKEDKEKK